MKRLLTILFFLPCLSLVSPRNYYAGTKYYISTSGTGSGNGLSTSTPWTLAQWNASSAWGAGDSVFIKAGDTLRGRMNFTRSGSAGNKVYVGRYGTGANPVVSGYTQLTTWTSYGGNVWAAAVPNLKAYLHNFMVNGQLYHQARYPNTGFITFTPGSTTSITTSESSPPNHVGDSVIVKSSRYTLDHAKITAQTGSVYTITSVPYTGVGGIGFYYFGDVKFLDTANEYAVVPTGDSVRIYSTVDPNTQGTYASTTDTLAYVTGSYITFEHITFQGGNMANVLNPFGSGNLTFRNCYNNLGWFGYDIRSQRDTITGGTIRDMLNVGVWAPTNNISKYCGIIGVTIRAIGVIPGMGKTNTGNYEAINFPADDFYCFNVDIDSVGYHGIFSSFDSVWIGYNIVNHHCLLLSDGGGIYVWEQNLTHFTHPRVIIGNLVLNGFGNTEGTTVTAGTMANGIYTDGKSNQVIISYNTCMGNSGPGLYNHGDTMTYLYNRSYDNGLCQFILSEFSGQPITGIDMRYNYFGCPDTSKALVFLYSPANDITSFLVNADSNYYATTNAVTPFQTQANGGSIIKRTLASWQSAMSFDSHSSHRTGALSLQYNTLFTNKNTYFRGRYINPAGNGFNQLVPLGPLASEILLLQDKGYVDIPAGTKIKAH